MSAATKDKATWQDHINHALALGYSVQFNEDIGAWTVLTPTRPRKPTEEHAGWKDQRAAWRAAAGMAHTIGGDAG